MKWVKVFSILFNQGKLFCISGYFLEFNIQTVVQGFCKAYDFKLKDN